VPVGNKFWHFQTREELRASLSVTVQAYLYFTYIYYFWALILTGLLTKRKELTVEGLRSSEGAYIYKVKSERKAKIEYLVFQ
jgi:tRNA(His) 5'-end guanylyltransferase